MLRGGASSDAQLHPAQVREELRRVLASPEFVSSERGRTFLTYIVESRLEGGLDRLKERTIGVEVFGRDLSYDTGQDAIVRVSAKSVRKRLNDYYSRLEAEGQEQGFRIFIPQGSYVPEFPWVREAPAGVVAEPAAAVGASRRGWLAWAAMLGLLVVLAAVCVYLAVDNRRLRLTQRAPQGIAVLPWSAVASQTDARIVLTDANFTLHRSFERRSMTLAEYVSLKWLQDLREREPMALPLTGIQYTSVVSAKTAARVSSLLEKAGCAAFIYGSRQLQISDFKEERPLILLGAAPSNPWVELFIDKLNFVPYVYINQDASQTWKNRSPLPGEPREYVASRNAESPATAYALIALLPNLGNKGPVMIIAGTSAEATEAAGEFVVDIPRLTEELRKRGIDPNSRPKHVELLLKVISISQGPRQFDVVAHRVR
jgi:hypothetical protein